MNAADYNRYLSVIKTANDMSDKDHAKEILRQIQADMVARYGLSDSDVSWLIKQFRYYV